MRVFHLNGATLIHRSSARKLERKIVARRALVSIAPVQVACCVEPKRLPSEVEELNLKFRIAITRDRNSAFEIRGSLCFPDKQCAKCPKIRSLGLTIVGRTETVLKLSKQVVFCTRVVKERQENSKRQPVRICIPCLNYRPEERLTPRTRRAQRTGAVRIRFATLATVA